MTIPALCKSDTGFQFPARLNTYCSAGIKKGLFIFVCEFVHYVPAGVRMPFRSFLLIRTLSWPFGRFGSRDFDRRGFDARPLEAAFERTAENRDSRSRQASTFSVKGCLDSIQGATSDRITPIAGEQEGRVTSALTQV